MATLCNLMACRQVMPRTDNNIPAMLAGRLPPEPRRPHDERKYAASIVPLGGHLSTRG